MFPWCWLVLLSSDHDCGDVNVQMPALGAAAVAVGIAA